MICTCWPEAQGEKPTLFLQPNLRSKVVMGGRPSNTYSPPQQTLHMKGSGGFVKIDVNEYGVFREREGEREGQIELSISYYC